MFYLDPLPTTDRRGRQSALRPGVPGAWCLGRSKRSPILNLNLGLGLLGTPTTQAPITTNASTPTRTSGGLSIGLGGLLTAPVTQTSPTTNILTSSRFGGESNTARGNQNAATGRQPTLFEQFGFTDLFASSRDRTGTWPNSAGGSGTTATARPSSGTNSAGGSGTAVTNRPTSGTGVGHTSGTNGHSHSSTSGNEGGTTSTSTAT